MTFEPIRTFTRGTETIAEIRIAGRTLYVHRKEGKLYHWLGKDKLVRNPELAALAEEMLGDRSDPYPERQCAQRGCIKRFTPQGPKDFKCPQCVERVAA